MRHDRCQWSGSLASSSVGLLSGAPCFHKSIKDWRGSTGRRWKDVKLCKPPSERGAVWIETQGAREVERWFINAADDLCIKGIIWSVSSHMMMNSPLIYLGRKERIALIAGGDDADDRWAILHPASSKSPEPETLQGISSPLQTRIRDRILGLFCLTISLQATTTPPPTLFLLFLLLLPA